MKKIRLLLALLLGAALLTDFTPLNTHAAPPAVLPLSAQRTAKQLSRIENSHFVITQVDGRPVCHQAAGAERLRPFERAQLHRLTTDNEPRQMTQPAGLQIILEGTRQLDQFPQAKMGFLRAALLWEQLIASPITITIAVDYGPTRFGKPYPEGQLGSSDSQFVGASDLYADVRQALIETASDEDEAALYERLPVDSVPTDEGDTTAVVAPSPVFRALGFLPPVADPDGEYPALGPEPSIGFNSNYPFDFDPSDGIADGTFDFETTALHEIGHVLGFDSYVGELERFPERPLRVAMLDLLRFRPGISLDSFPFAERVLSSGGDQVLFLLGQELPLSTARRDYQGGDHWYPGHWKEWHALGKYEGIMAPVSYEGDRTPVTLNDLLALDRIGYRLRPAAGGYPLDILPLSLENAEDVEIGETPSEDDCHIGLSQYKVQVPRGVTRLKIELRGKSHVGLFASYGNAVLVDDGELVTDFRGHAEGEGQAIVIDSAALRAGSYYVAIANCGGAANLVLTATVTYPPPSFEISDLEATLDGDKLITKGARTGGDGSVSRAEVRLMDEAGRVVNDITKFVKPAAATATAAAATTGHFTIEMPGMDAYPTAVRASVRLFDGAANRSNDAAVDFSQAAAGAPRLLSASFAGDRLSMRGKGLGGALQVEVNGVVVADRFNASNKKAAVSGSPADLHLRDGANRLRVRLAGGGWSNILVIGL